MEARAVAPPRSRPWSRPRPSISAVAAEPRIRRPLVDTPAVPVRPPAAPSVEVGLDPPRTERPPSTGVIIAGRAP